MRSSGRKRRVIQLITRMIVGGAQRVALDTAVELSTRGDEVEIWCGPQTGPEGSLRSEATEKGLTVRIVPDLVKEVDPRRDLRAFRWITRRLRDTRPDLVHTHSSKAGILGRRAAHDARVARAIHTIHGWGFSERTPPLARSVFIAAERAAARWCETLIAVSESTRRLGLQNRIGSPDQYRVIRPGIDVAPFRDLGRLRHCGMLLRDQLGIDRSTPLAGTIGRLAPQKNPLFLLDAAEATDSIAWLIVGDGPLRAELEAEIERRHLAGRVHLAGLQSDAASALGALDLFVLPSLWEGAPLTLLEAAAAAVPIVAFDVGGVGELLAEGPTGRLVEPNDLERFVAAVRESIDRRSRWSDRLLQRREEILDRQPHRVMLDALVELYEADPSPNRGFTPGLPES